MIWITHDLAVVSGLADRIAVMYAGRIVESGATADVVHRPSHPYTQGLINSIPTRATHGSLLKQIPGMTPSLLHLPQGCAFRPRCGYATDVCLTVPEAIAPPRSAFGASPSRGQPQQPGEAGSAGFPAEATVRCWHALA
jgi:peptide/nickel transport system ATP-binding protein